MLTRLPDCRDTSNLLTFNTLLETLTQACQAARLGEKPPSLLPDSTTTPVQTPVFLLPQAS